MSGEETSALWRRKWEFVQRLAMDPRLNQSAVCTGLRLLEHMDRESGLAWPSNRTLAADIRVSERTIQEALALLRRHGYIETTPRGRGWQHRLSFDGEPVPEGRRGGPRTPGSVTRSRKRASETSPDLGSGLPQTPAGRAPGNPVPAYGATPEDGFRDFNTANLRRGTRSRKNGATISEDSRTDLGSGLPTNPYNPVEPLRARACVARPAGPVPRERSPPGKGEGVSAGPERHPLNRMLEARMRKARKTERDGRTEDG